MIAFGDFSTQATAPPGVVSDHSRDLAPETNGRLG